MRDLQNKVAKQTRNPARTRQSLLNAATKLFSNRGYDAVSVDDIVREARINKRMVYHYFGSKQKLYAEVLQTVFSRLSDLELKSFEDASDPVDAIRGILKTYFEFLGKNPEFVALLSWENLHRGRHIGINAKVLSKSPVLEQLEQIVNAAAQKGVFRSGIKVKHLLINLISICFVYHANRHTLSSSVGLDLRSPETLREGLEHAIDLTLHGLLR